MVNLNNQNYCQVESQLYKLQKGLLSKNLKILYRIKISNARNLRTSCNPSIQLYNPTDKEHDSISRTIKRKGMQNIRREIPAYADPIYGLPPKPTQIPTHVTPEKTPDSDIDAFEQYINTDLKKIPHIKNVWYQKYTKGQTNHISRKHWNCKV